MTVNLWQCRDLCDPFTCAKCNFFFYEIKLRLFPRKKNHRRSFHERRVGTFNVCKYMIISPYHGSKVEIRKMCSSTNVSSQTSSSSSLGKLDISSTKINDFCNFAETNLRSNSYKMIIHLLYFSPIILLVRMNWNGLTWATTKV